MQDYNLSKENSFFFGTLWDLSPFLAVVEMKPVGQARSVSSLAMFRRCMMLGP